MKLYLAGAITGNKYYRDDFAFHADELRALGHEVVSPVELDPVEHDDSIHDWTPDTPAYQQYLRTDAAALLGCDGIALIPGWEKSYGVRREIELARSYWLPVYEVRLHTEGATLVPVDDEPILEEAARITSGDRNKFYGHPLDNHGLTAELWALWLERKYGCRLPLTAEDVCWLNSLQKHSREANAPKRDNMVDVCGYMRNLEMIGEERRRRAVGDLVATRLHPPA